MNKAYKFRLYPNKEQELLLIKTFGCCRFIYNKMLGDKIDYYKDNKSMLKNTPAQYKQEFEWLKEVDSYALCNEQMHLQSAFNNFFRKQNIGFPKFKSKKRHKQSYTTSNVNNVIRVNNNKIHLPKLEWVKFKKHREIPKEQKIKSVTISKTSSGKYYIAILVEYSENIPQKELNRSNALGLDYASHSFYVDSQGREANYPKFYRNALEKLSKEQKSLSRKKYGSNNYHKQRLKVAKFQEHISNQRNDWIHKISTELANTYDYICIEDINLQEISQHLNLGKSTMDNGFGIFRNLLEYKMKDRGKKLIKIDKWYPSSKTCRFCKKVNKELQLNEREWTCKCGAKIERDVNAAINILNQGLLLV